MGNEVFYEKYRKLPIAAVVCGSIDLKRIQAGLYSKKGRGFDIAGIALEGNSYFICFNYDTSNIYHSQFSLLA